MKKCYGCKINLPFANFNKSKTRKDGLAQYCRVCRKAEHRKRYLKYRHGIIQRTNLRAKKVRAQKPKRVLLTPGQKKANIKRWQLMHLYGLTLEQYEELYKLQNGACAICRISFISIQKHVDHDHTSGLVRGLLCSNCNTGLGLFKDNRENLINASEYLINTRSNPFGTVDKA